MLFVISAWENYWLSSTQFGLSESRPSYSTDAKYFYSIIFHFASYLCWFSNLIHSSHVPTTKLLNFLCLWLSFSCVICSTAVKFSSSGIMVAILFKQFCSCILVSVIIVFYANGSQSQSPTWRTRSCTWSGFYPSAWPAWLNLGRVLSSNRYSSQGDQDTQAPPPRQGDNSWERPFLVTDIIST